MTKMVMTYGLSLLQFFFRYPNEHAWQANFDIDALRTSSDMNKFLNFLIEETSGVSTYDPAPKTLVFFVLSRSKSSESDQMGRLARDFTASMHQLWMCICI